MKILVEVKQLYTFEYETDKESRREIIYDIEAYWDKISSLGLEGDKFQETEIDYREI